MKEKSLREYRPLSLRIWHWLNALVIMSLLLTVLLRKTLLSWRTNSSIIMSKLESAGHSISSDLAADIAKTIRNPLWDWHILLGYALGALLLSRLLIAIFVEKRCLFLSVFKSISNKTILQKTTRHYYLIKALYAIFHLMTFVVFITGLVLIFKKDLALERAVIEIFKEVHEISMWFFIAFIVAHLIGIIISENGKDAGIVSDMISGGKKE